MNWYKRQSWLVKTLLWGLGVPSLLLTLTITYAFNQPTETEIELSDSKLVGTTVTQVVDGDTIKVNINGISDTVRLIGIDTPETVHPSKPVECFGKEASNKAKELLEGQTITLEADPSQGERGKYKRLLRYVFLADGTDFNKLMISEGYAYEYTYNSPYKYQDAYKQAQKDAESGKLGLWGDGVCNQDKEIPITSTNPESNPATTPNDTIIDDFPDEDMNCSDFSTHREAQDYFESKGGSPSNNADGLDRDRDGIACESLS